MITIQDLTKTYGRFQALRGVDLEIGPGLFGLLGPNGAGKTTLMRILAGLIRPSGGSVNAFGNDIATPRGKLALKSRLGYLPQELGLYPDLTAREFLDYVGVLKGLAPDGARREQIDAVLDRVHLTRDADRVLKTYSGGMQRRVGIAQALLGEPDLLIVDEPTAGLDPEERVNLRNLLVDVAVERTVLLSTHIVEDVSQSCSALAVMAHGTVIFKGHPRTLIDRARGRVSSALITDGSRPPAHLAVVAAQQQVTGVQYRVLGDAVALPDAVAVEPTLEDGYIWLMRNRETAGQAS